jgi:hypothetical protein
VFVDEVRTCGYFPMLTYYQGRVREGLNSAGFVDAYRAYLQVRESAGEDPLLADIRQRIASSTPTSPKS